MNFSGPIIPPNVRVQEEIIRQWYETQIQMANVHSAKAALRITEQVNQTLNMTMAQLAEQNAKVMSVVVEDVGRPEIMAVVATQERGDTCVAVGTVAEKDEAPPIRAVKSSGQSVAKIDIEIPPGTKMMAWVRLLFSEKTRELVFEPIVADYQYEIFEALKAGCPKSEIRRIQARHWFGFVHAVVRQIARSIGEIVRALKGAG